jgi:uncharacterized membrane protein
VTGPVQVLVVGFDQPSFSGEVIAEFARLRDAGIVRLVDMLVVSRTAEDTFEALDLAEGLEADLGEVAASILGQPENSAATDRPRTDIDTASTWSLADAIPVGGTAAVALIEHTWAGPLSAAIQRAGGTVLEETWLAREDHELLEALIAERQS